MNRGALYFGYEAIKVMDANTSGVVHSIFTNSMNGLFGNRLVHIGTRREGLVPFGIGLTERDNQMLLGLVRPNETITWHQDRRLLTFDKMRETISLAGAEAFDASLGPYAFDIGVLKSNIQKVIQLITTEQWECGFEEDMDVCMEAIFSYQSWMHTHPVLHALSDLVRSVSGACDVEVKSLLDYWIGRGQGLTPSGDDLLVGMLCMSRAAASLPQTFESILADYIYKRGAKRTTQISLEYLLYATDDKFGSHVQDFCFALLKDDPDRIYQTAAELRKVGHTSSADALLGILLACQCIIRGATGAPCE